MMPLKPLGHLLTAINCIIMKCHQCISTKPSEYLVEFGDFFRDQKIKSNNGKDGVQSTRLPSIEQLRSY